MKRLIAYLACATLVATSGYAYRKIAKADLQSADQTTELRLSRFEESNESQAVGETTESVVAGDGRHLSKRAKEVLGKLQGKAEHQASNLKTQNVRPLSDPTPVTAPFTCNFDTQEILYNNWFTIDGNGDGDTWCWEDLFTDTGAASIWYNEYEALDDYLVTINPISLEAGDAYISFDYGGFGSFWYESFEVVYGTSSDVGQMSQIISYDNFAGGVTNNAIVPFTVPSDGDYYFAFHATSKADQYGIWIDNVEINSGSYKGTPDIVVTSVTLPSPSLSLTGSETITATVYNQGSSGIASYSLSWVAECNGSSQTSSLQTVATPLAIGESATVELAMPVDMSTEGVYTVTVTASDVTADGYEEADTSNNSATATTTHFGVTDVPFDVDFSTGEQNDKWASDGSWVYDGDYYYSLYCYGTGALKSQGVNLEGGKSYRVTYSYMAGNSFWGTYTAIEDFDVLCGKADEEMAVIQSASVRNTDYSFVSGEATYTCSESGVYQFGFSQDYVLGTFYIQSVQISEIADYDLAISGFSAYPTMLPLPQAVAVSTDVTVVNRGNQSCTTGVLTISAGGSTLATVDVPEIASGATAIVPVEYSLSSFAAGSEVNVEAYVSITGQSDANETDNSASFSMTITEDELAYDQMTDDKYSSRYCISVSGGSFVAAVPIHLNVDDVLTGISVGWGAADGQTIQLEVYKYDPDDYVNNNGTVYYNLGELILSTTAEQGTENGQIRYSTSPRALEAGDYMICVGCTGYCLVVDAVTPGYLYLISSGYAIDQSSAGLGTAAIRAIFGEGTAAAYDLTVNGITSPDGSGLYSSNQSIVVSVTNNGYEAAEGTLEVTVNGEALESQPVSLAAYITETYTFMADMSTPGDYTIVATATLAGDENPDDNSVEKTVTSAELLDPYVMDFEGCEDFSVDGFNPEWTTVDGDGSYVFTLNGLSEACGFMAFNPYTYESSDYLFRYYPYAVPCSGEKYGVSFAAYNPPNDDWLISPLLTMPESGSSLTMQVQSLTADFGLELYEVCVSTTDNDPSSFTVVASGEAPAEEWGEVTVDLSAYDGQDIYVAIHCVSNDAWLFLVDDIVITKPSESSGISGNLGGSAGLVLYPNPVSETMVISAEGRQIENVTIYSMSGALAGMVKSATGEVRYDVSGLAPGVYFAKVKTENGTQVMKFVKK